jgi:ADP-ribosylglycohydrolase
VIGQGPTSRATLDALQAEGESWLTAGARGKHKTTNGSIMRAAPIGLLGWLEPTGQLLTASAVVQSHVTHHASLCKRGSVAIATSVAAALKARLSDTAAAADGSQLAGAVLAALEPALAAMLGQMLAAPSWQDALAAMYAAWPPPPEFLETSPFRPPSVTMYPPHTAGW